MKRLVIFDLDGTLLNTIDDLGNAANYALAQCGYPIHDISAYPLFVGNGIKRLIERAMPENARTDGNIEKLRKLFTEYYNRHNTDLTKPYEGISELLSQLSKNRIKLAVASNKYHSAVEKLISHFFPEIPWAAIEGQKDNYPAKPNPAIILDILSKCPTNPDDALYVGDSGVDIETARRAGIESVGVTWGFRPVTELIEYNADNIAYKPHDVLKIANRPNLYPNSEFTSV